MKRLLNGRPARTPLQEGASMAPYLLLYQREHRRRWAVGLAVTAFLGAVVLMLRRR